jgi:hypothetical protein
MTPQEKANELILKYLRIENTNEWWSKVPAKQCALIAVDEVISVIDAETNYKTWEFYKQVKQEIEKL